MGDRLHVSLYGRMVAGVIRLLYRSGRSPAGSTVVVDSRLADGDGGVCELSRQFELRTFSYRGGRLDTQNTEWCIRRVADQTCADPVGNVWAVSVAGTGRGGSHGVDPLFRAGNVWPRAIDRRSEFREPGGDGPGIADLSCRAIGLALPVDAERSPHRPLGESTVADDRAGDRCHRAVVRSVAGAGKTSRTGLRVFRFRRAKSALSRIDRATDLAG